MTRLMLDKEPWPFVWIKIWDEGASGNKWWALSFNILFKFEIDNWHDQRVDVFEHGGPVKSTL